MSPLKPAPCCALPSEFLRLTISAESDMIHLIFGQAKGGHRALCLRCAKSRLFFTTGSHGSRGPEFCTLQPLLVHQGFFVLV